MSVNKKIRESYLFTFQYGSTLIRCISTEVTGFYYFTFQYGSTLMICFSVSSVSLIIFTFQYGSTLMEKEMYQMYLLRTLHSNMVLL